MKKFEIGQSYVADNGDTLTITSIEYYNPWGDCIHFASETITQGLIDCDGLYFLSYSEYAKSLTLIS